MSSVGWTNTIMASTIMDKEQNVQQMQPDTSRAFVEANVLREQRTQQTTVTNTPDGKKARMHQRREKRREERDRGQHDDETGQKILEGSKKERTIKPKRINVIV